MEKSNSVTTAVRAQRGVISRRNSRVASNMREKPGNILVGTDNIK